MVLEKTLQSPLDCKYFGHLMWRAESLAKALMLGKIEGRRRRGQQRVRWLDVIADSMDMSLSKLWEKVKVRESCYATVHGVAKSWTRLSDETTIKVRQCAPRQKEEHMVVSLYVCR